MDNQNDSCPGFLCIIFVCIHDLFTLMCIWKLTPHIHVHTNTCNDTYSEMWFTKRMHCPKLKGMEREAATAWTAVPILFSPFPRHICPSYSCWQMKTRSRKEKQDCISSNITMQHLQNVRSIRVYQSIYLYKYLCIYLSVYLSIYLYIYLSIYLSI